MAATRTVTAQDDVSDHPATPGRVVVLGSLNVDHTVWVERLPDPGEAVLGRAHTVTLGGKGLTQAVSAARQGAEVSVVGTVGRDVDGDQVIAALEAESIDTSHVGRHPDLPTGRAYITVADDFAATIAVVPGANLAVEVPDAALKGAQVLLAQLECPLDVVVTALSKARAGGAVTVLNPSPPMSLSREILDLVDYLVPNEREARTLGVVRDYPSVGTLIVTHGEAGASVRKRGREKWLPPVDVPEVVDPTAAGDAFCGALAAGLANGVPFGMTLNRAAAAGAHAVTVAGALPSMPTAADVDALLGDQRQG
jgi:ribokinase